MHNWEVARSCKCMQEFDHFKQSMRRRVESTCSPPTWHFVLNDIIMTFVYATYASFGKQPVSRDNELIVAYMPEITMLFSLLTHACKHPQTQHMRV
eukprot:2688229-Amphidinium_carterae.1